MPKLLTGLFLAAALVGCAAQSHVIVGTVRAPIPPEQVKIYLQPPKQYEQVAIVNASSRHSGAFTEQTKLDRAIGRLKEEAAKLGANGVLLQATGTQQVGSVGTGIGTSSFSGNSGFGTGFSIGTGINAKTADGVAIYVTEE